MTQKSEKAKSVSLREAVKQGKTEIVVREGQAELIREKKVISINGIISAPREFFENRHGEHDHHEADKAHVLFSKQENKITLILNENSHWAKTITGVLKTNPELDSFRINKDATYSIKELSDFLKMRKFYFKEREEATKIIGNLQKFKASIQTEIESDNDTRGNKMDLFVTKVKSNLDMGFTLKTNIFKGQPEKLFKVEIECEVRDEEMEVWLVSEELRLLELENTEKIFEQELKQFKDAKVVCIEQ